MPLSMTAMASSKTSVLGKLAGEFQEGRHEWRTPLRGAAQLFDRLLAASGAPERGAQQGFDTGIAASRRFFQGHDRFRATVLRDQGPCQDRQGVDVEPAGSQNFCGELFGLGKTLRSKRVVGAFEQLDARYDAVRD